VLVCSPTDFNKSESEYGDDPTHASAVLM